jgi:5'(3')-deoxyribonucleotidase
VPKIKHIFIDMDGVLSNWLDAACESLGIDVKNKEIRQKTKGGIWLDQMGFFTEEEMWNIITAEGTDWWANLPIYPWATRLINKMKEFGEIHFLTSPGLCEMAPTGKVQWIMKFFGKEYLRQLIIAKHKYMCAGPDRILIDDSERRLKEFVDAGGYGFLWPCPFSIEDGDIGVDDTIEKIIMKIRGINKQYSRSSVRVMAEVTKVGRAT